VIDYQAVLADAVRKYQALALIVQGLTQLIDAPPAPVPVARTPLVTVARRALKAAPKPHRPAAKVQRPAAGSAAKAKPASAKVATSTAAKHPGISAPAEVLARAKAVAAREGLRAAATATGIGYQTLYGRAIREHWPFPKRRGAHRADAKPKGEKTPPRVCPSCQLHTRTDPCDLCGTKWKRTEA